MKHALVFLLAILLLPVTDLEAQSGWIKRTVTTTQPQSSYFRMVYDEDRQRIVVVAYGRQSTHLDVSEWDGQGWTHQTTNLDVRLRFGIGYDAHRKQLVLVGGVVNRVYLNETWTWDGTTWTQVSGVGPGARSFPEIAYDSKRERLMLYGGLDAQGGRTDTMEFDGTDWKVVPTATTPFPKNAYSMVYDEARDKMLLIGGFSLGGFAAETWSLEANGWVQRQRIIPPNLNSNFWTTYDPIAQRVVYLASGFNGPTETWEWTGTVWQQIQTAQPLLDFTVMAYDRARGEIVAYGNEGAVNNDTWVYRSPLPRAEARVFGQGCGTPPARLLAGTGSLPILGQSFTVDATDHPGSMGWLTAGLSDQTLGALTLPLDLTPLNMPGCLLYQSMEASWSFPLTAGSGSISLPIPNSASLRGLRIYLQSTSGTVASNGLRMTCGAQ